jgi:hypothetical protein
LSKGFTKRNVTVAWAVVSVTPSNSAIQTSLQAILTSYANLKYFTLPESTVETLAGTIVTFKAVVTNFLGNSANNATAITFLSSKKIEIHGL